MTLAIAETTNCIVVSVSAQLPACGARSVSVAFEHDVHTALKPNHETTITPSKSLPPFVPNAGKIGLIILGRALIACNRGLRQL